jgi:hypothetical protein
MNVLKSLVLIAGAAVSAVGASAAQAQEYGAFQIRNDSNSTIYYQVRWGENGTWMDASVAPGATMSHWYPLDASGRAPAPYIRFDWIGGDADVTYKNYHLDFYATYDVYNGKPYVFRYWDDGVHLDLSAA